MALEDILEVFQGVQIKVLVTMIHIILNVFQQKRVLALSSSRSFSYQQSKRVTACIAFWKQV